MKIAIPKKRRGGTYLARLFFWDRLGTGFDKHPVLRKRPHTSMYTLIDQSSFSYWYWRHHLPESHKELPSDTNASRHSSIYQQLLTIWTGE